MHIFNSALMTQIESSALLATTYNSNKMSLWKMSTNLVVENVTSTPTSIIPMSRPIISNEPSQSRNTKDW